MFEYFRSYPSNLAMALALETGGVISEIDDVCRPFRDVPDNEADRVTLDWAKGWRSLGEKLDRQAKRDEAANHRSQCSAQVFAGRFVLHDG